MHNIKYIAILSIVLFSINCSKKKNDASENTTSDSAPLADDKTNHADDSTKPADDKGPVQHNYSVWCGSFDNGFKTALFAVNNGNYSKTTEKDGLIIHSKSGTWELKSEKFQMKTSDCASCEGQENCPVIIKDYLRYILVNTTSKDKIILLDPGADYKDMTFNEKRNITSVGPYIFARSCTQLYGCGAAHDSISCSQVIFNLDTKEKVELNDFVTPIPLEERQKYAIESWHKEVGSDSDPTFFEADDSKEPIKLKNITPTWNDKGEASFIAKYSFTTSFLASYGDEDSYEAAFIAPVKEVKIPLINIPPSIADYMKKSKMNCGVELVE